MANPTGPVNEFSSEFSAEFGPSSTSSGTWSGTLSVPQGGWYKIQYRLAADQAAIYTAQNIFGVGDVWMLAGQSQQARMSTLLNAPPTPDDRAVYFNGSSGWASPGVLAGTGGNGVIRFLNQMIAATNLPQACIQVSVEGTAITDWESVDPAYATATSRLSAVQAIAGVLWHQGGTGIGTISRVDYKAKLEALFTGFSQAAAIQRYGVFPLMHRTNAADTDVDTQETRRAHFEYIAEHAGVINLGWYPSIPLADDVHQTAAGSELIAWTYAHSLLFQMGVEPVNNLGPSIVSATRSGTSVVLNVQHRSGTSLKTQNSLPPTGFQVYPRGTSQSDAAALAISSIVLGAATITINLAADPGTAVDVYYQWGRFDNTAPVFDDSTGMGRTVGNALLPLMTPVQTAVEAGQASNSALKLDNDTGHVRYSDSSAWDLPDADWTIGIWIRLDANAGTTSQYLFSTGAYQATNAFNFFVYESGATTTPNRYEFSIRGAGSAITLLGALDAASVTNAWRLWIVERVKSTDTVNVYYLNVNGARVLYHSQSVAGLGSVLPTTGAALGTRAPPASGSARWLDGAIGNFFKLNTLMTQPEMEAVAKGSDPPAPVIYSRLNTLTSPIANSGTGGTVNATILGTVTLTQGPQYTVATDAVQFDPAGTMTYTMPRSASHTLPNANWTLGFFASVSDNAGTTGQYMYSTGTTPDGKSMQVLFWRATSANPNAFGLNFESDNGTDFSVITPSVASLLDGTWRLWTVERFAGVINIYQTPVNGTRQSVYQYVVPSAMDSITPIAPVMTIGGRWSGAGPATRYFGGKMYLAFQTDGAISAANTEAIARGRDPRLDLALAPKWMHRFNTTDSPLNDLSGNGNTATRTAGTASLSNGPVFVPLAT